MGRESSSRGADKKTLQGNGVQNLEEKRKGGEIQAHYEGHDSGSKNRGTGYTIKT